MIAAGLEPLARVERLAAMGFTEVVWSLPRHVMLYRRLLSRARAGRYAGAVLIDYPGFHLRLGRALRRAGVPVIQYVAPQLWAWRPSRLGHLRLSANAVAAVLPFEAPWFQARGVDCRFVGHPVTERSWPSREAARATLGLAPAGPVLGIFPGSRRQEIRAHWPLFREVGQRLLAAGHCAEVVVAGTAGGSYPEAGPMTIVRGSPELVQAAATALLVKSGTATLEAALADRPMVVAYRTGRLTFEIARRQMTVHRISLVNLIAEQDVVPEFWHPPFSAAPVAEAVRPLLDESTEASRRQRMGLDLVRRRLGPGGAAARVVDLLCERLAC